MNKIKQLVMLVTVLGTFFTSCKEEMKPSKTGNYISGKFENITGGEMVLLQRLSSREIITLDTFKIDMEGNFEMAPEIEELGFYRVFISNNNFFNFISQPAETLKLAAQIDDLEGTYQVTGSDESDILAVFNGMMNTYVDQMDSLRIEMEKAKASQNPGLGQSVYQAQMMLNAQTGENARAFVKENSDKLASLSALQQFDPEQDLELYEMVISNLEPKMANNDLFQDLKERVEMAKRLLPGAVLPDLISNTVDGKTLKLSEIKGEKYTLVDFWAAWCKPCRAENPVVVQAYNKYHSKGFEILGVSLDKDANQWVAAIKADGLLWPQVSDLLFWESPTAKQYNIRSIPANFLIDSEMRIIAKNLRGAELDAKLAELIGG
ncbi:MAG: peroxiredoxin family protein [Salibacteraceae bacterium]